MDVDALVALQAHEVGPGRGRQRLGDLGLAHAGLALQQQRVAELGRQEHGGAQRAVGEVALAGQGLADRAGAAEGVGQRAAAARVSARRVSTRARWRL